MSYLSWVSGHCDIPKLRPLVWFCRLIIQRYFWPNTSARDCDSLIKLSLILLLTLCEMGFVGSLTDHLTSLHIFFVCFSFSPKKPRHILIYLYCFLNSDRSVSSLAKILEVWVKFKNSSRISFFFFFTYSKIFIYNSP